MVLFVLAETAAGLALLKAKEKKLLKRDDLAEELSSTEGVTNLLKLKQFKKFESAVSAVEEAASLIEGKVSPMLSSLLDSIKDEKKASLAVADPKLGNAINKLPQLSLQPISDSTTADLYRAIRENLTSLIPGLMPQDLSTMSLGLSHSLSRHKLKFSPDKVDTMIVHAIALLDDLDKELNTYAMRVKEWYGWHFPEMGKIINDNLAYSRVILKMGLRSNAVNSDLAEILPEDIETAVKAAAEISMGTEITTEDLDNIQGLATEVVELTEYRQQLSNYLTARMTAIAPNLTALVGELVGARLIAHAGSLINLAKSPASTIQILGAEKALFRALKTKHDTPKYGLIYHASLIGQATGKNKGKIARMLATKAAIGLRVDALSEWGAGGEGMAVEPTEEEKAALGHESRIKIERRLRGLEGKPLLPKGVAVGPSGLKVTPGKWEIKEARKYNPDADGLGGDEPAAASKPIQESAKKSKKDKEGDVKMIEEEDEAEESDESEEEEDEEEEPAEAAEEVDEDEDEEDEEEEEEEEDESESESEAESPVVNGTSPTKEPEAPATEALSKKEKKRLKKERQGKTEGAETHRLAAQAGMSVVRFSRKLKRGEIRVVDGKPIVMTKKEMKAAKKARKAEKKHAKLAAKRGAKSYSDRGRKRKLEDDVAEKPAKKKNKAKYNKNKE